MKQENKHLAPRFEVVDGVELSHYLRGDGVGQDALSQVSAVPRLGVQFLHGNGFPIASYQPLLAQLFQPDVVVAQDAPGHGASPATEHFLGWNRVSELFQLVLERKKQQVSAATWVGVGHSFGGVMTLLMAARKTTLFKRLVLLDPALYPPNFIWQLRGATLRGKQDRQPLIRQTLRRRRHWPSASEAYESLHEKGVFKGWDERCFSAYIEKGMRVDEEGCHLRYPPELEAALFASFPAGLWQSVRKLSVPTTIIAGRDTYPHFLQAYQMAAEQNPLIKVEFVDGGHCFMMEYPDQTALRINELLKTVD